MIWWNIAQWKGLFQFGNKFIGSTSTPRWNDLLYGFIFLRNGESWLEWKKLLSKESGWLSGGGGCILLAWFDAQSFLSFVTCLRWMDQHWACFCSHFIPIFLHRNPNYCFFPSLYNQLFLYSKFMERCMHHTRNVFVARCILIYYTFVYLSMFIFACKLYHGVC